MNTGDVVLPALIVAAGGNFLLQRINRFRLMRAKVREPNPSDSLLSAYSAERIGIVGTMVSFAMIPVMVIAIMLGAGMTVIEVLVGIGALGVVVTALSSVVAGWHDDGSWRDT